MPGSPAERRERVDALLDVVAERRRAPISGLVSLAVRSWLVNSKTAKEYVDLILEAGWVTLEGYDYIMTPAGHKHLREIDDWPEDPGKIKTRSQRKRDSNPPPPPSTVGAEGRENARQDA